MVNSEYIIELKQSATLDRFFNLNEVLLPFVGRKISFGRFNAFVLDIGPGSKLLKDLNNNPLVCYIICCALSAIYTYTYKNTYTYMYDND